LAADEATAITSPRAAFCLVEATETGSKIRSWLWGHCGLLAFLLKLFVCCYRCLSTTYYADSQSNGHYDYPNCNGYANDHPQANYNATSYGTGTDTNGHTGACTNDETDPGSNTTASYCNSQANITSIQTNACATDTDAVR